MTDQIIILETALNHDRIGRPARIVRATSLDGRIVFDGTGWLDKTMVDSRELGVCCYMDGDREVISADHYTMRQEFVSALSSAENAMPTNIEWSEKVAAESARREEKMRRMTEERAAADAARKTEVEAFIAAVPAVAVEELRAHNRRLAAHWSAINEGGNGYVEQSGWTDPKGREILARHGLADIVVPDGF